MEIGFSGVTKRFRSTLALNQVTAELTGKVNLLLGTNGSGKTTLINIVAGLGFPEEGTIRLGSLECSAKDRKAWRSMLERERKKMGFLLDKPGQPSYFRGDEILEWASKRSTDANETIEHLKEALGMSSFLRKPIGGYSSGMAQKLGIAESLVSGPELVLWDEPTANLDAVVRRSVARLVKEYVDRGTTFVIASHTPVDFEGVADWVGVMNLGRLVEAGPVLESGRGSRWYSIETDSPALLAARLAESGVTMHIRIQPGEVTVELAHDASYEETMKLANSLGVRVTSVSQVPKSISELYSEVLAKLGQGDHGVAEGRS